MSKSAPDLVLLMERKGQKALFSALLSELLELNETAQTGADYVSNITEVNNKFKKVAKATADDPELFKNFLLKNCPDYRDILATI